MSDNNDRERQNSTLPTFTSIRDQPSRSVSYAESSKASSSRSAISRARRKEENDEDTAMNDLDQGGNSNSLRREELRNSTPNGSARRPKRSSGGFLLDSSPTSSRLSRSLLSRKVRGKQRLEDDITSSAKRRSQIAQFDGPDSSPSVRDSLLSTDIRSSPPVRQASSYGGSIEFRDTLNGSLRSRTSQKPDQTYGLDTDPAKIVDMALRLSEGRRKQASEKRVISDVPEGRRIVSMATSLPPRSTPSPKSGTLKRKQPPQSVGTPQKRHRDSNSEVVAEVQHQLPDEWSPEQEIIDEDLKISRATRNRVQKAKAYFELAYEHRRLLPHLPPIRSPDSDYDPQKPGYESKAYNPLQYVRNRKLRFRERCPLNPEADGWHDVQKVRLWVDAVVSSHATTSHNPLQCVRLPPLTLAEKDLEEGGNDSNAESRPRNRNAKPKRPKSDWITHPGDLLADAFWTEQGSNKCKIYNRDNEPIYPAGTQFSFTGWRNRTPVHVPESLIKQASSPEASPIQRKQSIPAAPELPTFESAHKDHTWARTRSKFASALNKKPQNSQKKANDIFDSSSESHSSDEDTDRKQSRGRKRLAKRKDTFNLSDGDPFAPAVRRADSVSTTESTAHSFSKKSFRKDSTDRSNMLKYLHRNRTSLGGNQSDSEKRELSKRRGFLGNIRVESDHERGRSSIDYDSTAPPTPAINGFPSIAINLSPPESRASSPSKKKSSIFGNVKNKVAGHKSGIETTDFAEESHDSRRGSSDRQSRSRLRVSAHPSSRGPSPMSRGTSPFSRHMSNASTVEAQHPYIEPRDSAVSKTSTRSNESAPHRSHRVRGMFKGGRIAELVGNEVSRVGEFIWKRDPPRKSGERDSGWSSGYESDSDDVAENTEDQAKRLNRPDQPLTPKSASTTKSPTFSSPQSKSSPRDGPQYHIQGLPSFTSPFQKDREQQDRRAAPQSPGGTPFDANDDSQLDPISTGAAASRAGRSPRFDRLAPPKLDIRAATPDGRRSSYGFGLALGLERARSASQLYNDAIGDNDNARRDSKALAGGAPLARFSTSGNDLTKSLSRDSGYRPSNKPITVRDLARVRGLMIAAAIKATNIAEMSEQIPQPQSSFLYQAFECTGAPSRDIDQVLPVRRRDEHVVAARHLISHLESKSSGFNDRLSDFTRTTTVELQREIQILGDTADGELFPRLQALSDTAGQLAQKLTTTSTLAVKSVNDEVAAAARLKRRGPQRLGRWLGYKLIEWAVVGVLWWIWAVVMIVRLCIGTVKGVWNGFAWLFWLK